MSLDLYIISKTPVKHKDIENNILYHNNITDNLIPMTTQCVITCNGVKVSLRRLLWNPDETGLLGKKNEITKEYIYTLAGCFGNLVHDKAKYVKYNSNNCWENYKELKDFLIDILTALNKIEPENYNNYTVEANL